jgi:hypothetical protein
MDMREDLRPDRVECPHCSEELDYVFFIQNWTQDGKVAGDGVEVRQQSTGDTFICPKCDSLLEDIETITGAQDFLNGIGKE